MIGGNRRAVEANIVMTALRLFLLAGLLTVSPAVVLSQDGGIADEPSIIEVGPIGSGEASPGGAMPAGAPSATDADVLGPLPLLNCSVSSLGALPIMACEGSSPVVFPALPDLFDAGGR